MEIKPINAIVYNQEIVDMDKVVAPPYDVITSEYCDELYERDPFNIVRLILTKGDNRYEDAKNYYEKWLLEGVLIKTKKPSIFYMIQKYTTESGRKIERKGFIARNKIESFESKKILPHEYTMGGPKADRLKLTKAIRANLSQIFMVYSDPLMTIENKVLPKYINQKPYIDVVDDNNVEHIVYLIDDEKDIKIIFPTHRIIMKDIDPSYIMEAVKKYYDVDKMQFEASNKNEVKKEFLEKIEESNKTRITTGLYLKNDNAFYILKLKDKMTDLIDAPDVLKKLDLVVLHELIVTKELNYTKDEQMAQQGIKYIKQEFEAFDAIDNNKASASFIMAYPKMKDITDISSQGYRMPQKSTYFYPKLLSGIVINPLHK